MISTFSRRFILIIVCFFFIFLIDIYIEIFVSKILEVMNYE